MLGKRKFTQYVKKSLDTPMGRRKYSRTGFYASRIPAPLYKVPRTVRLSGRGGVTNTKPELKCVDLPLTTYQMSNVVTNANVYLLNAVQEGVSEQNRVGKRIHMKSLYFNGFFQSLQTIDNQPSYCRVMIIYDRQPNAAAALPLYSDFIRQTDQSGVVTSSYLANANIDNRDRFVILRDIRKVLPPCIGATAVSTITTASTCDLLINDFIKLELDTQYNINAVPITVSNINTGALYMVLTGDTAPGANNWALDATFRLRYTDY
nr:MAG: capsid protein [Cressdnaviricota sp.]